MLKGVLPEKHFECFGVMNFFLGFLFRLLHHSRHWYYHYYYGKHFYDYLFKIKFFKCFSFVLATIHSLISLWTVPWITTNILAIQLLTPQAFPRLPPLVPGTFRFLSVPQQLRFDSQGLKPVLNISLLHVGHFLGVILSVFHHYKDPFALSSFPLCLHWCFHSSLGSS